MNDYIIYLLINSINNYTYVGITNNPERRLRQHNGIIKGGAKYTKINKKNGIWDYYGFILGCEKSEALSIEKKIHINTKKIKAKSNLERRLICINKILESYDYLSFTVL